LSEYFLDASALVKRYAPEQGSTWVNAITTPDSHHSLLVSEITLVEVSAALAAKGRGPSGMSIQARDRALSRFLEDSERLLILLRVDRTVIDRAVTLVLGHRLRAYDAVQLATAIVAKAQLAEHGYPSLTFVTADRDLLGAAGSEGLAVENPLDHRDK